MTARCCCFSFINMLILSSAFALPEGYNYDESKVPNFVLPDPMMLANGKRVTNAESWRTRRRPEILQLFETHVYGRTPADGSRVRFDRVEIDSSALGGTAIRKQVKILFDGTKKGPAADLLIYLPVNVSTPVPVFVGLNFRGNHTIQADTGVWLPRSWQHKQDDGTVVDRRAKEEDRGSTGSRWPVQEIIARGYGVATIFCNDIDPDFDDGFQNGVHPLFYSEGQVKPADDQWATIGAWAWGLSRALDYFETDQDVDEKQVAVLGFSRLGKAALWAGAKDERFAMVISNDSGCGGAALSRRRFGETVKRINAKFPHWFCENFKKYNDNEEALPVDQHMLAALVAPRPLYVASAEQDVWADPRGEFLSLKYASPVYELLGRKAIGNVNMPAVNEPVMRDLAYHIRTGKHDITLYDWQRFMDFADEQFEVQE